MTIKIFQTNVFSDILAKDALTYPSLLEAMPQLLPTDQLKRAYIESWAKFAKDRLKYGEATKSALTSHSTPLYSVKKKGKGVFFISQDGVNIDYLYAYQAVKLKGVHRPSEALAYLYNPLLRGVTKEVFFDHLLPLLKFVVTDSLYTPDGHRWFQSQYKRALANPSKYQVWGIDTKIDFNLPISREEFHLLSPSLWGTDDPFKKYRFAIELKS